MRPTPPQIEWRAVLIGGAAAFATSAAVAALSAAASSDLLLVAATPVGLALGGAVAGRISGVFGLLQGGMVGVLWVFAEALADTFAPTGGDILADVALVLIADAGRIALAAAAGWAGARFARPSTPSSSSDRGRGR